MGSRDSSVLEQHDVYLNLNIMYIVNYMGSRDSSVLEQHGVYLSVNIMYSKSDSKPIL